MAVGSGVVLFAWLFHSPEAGISALAFWLPWFAGSVFLVVAATLCFCFWKDITVQYHLYLLRAPSGGAPYFLESLTENEASPRFLALGRFVEGAPLSWVEIFR